MGNFRDSIETYANYINKLKNDPAVRGLIFSQYSGGGSGIAAELLRQTFEDFKKTKPVIIYAHAIGSAAYLSSLGANLIIASSKMSHIGSIGAVVNIDRMQAYYESVMIQSIYAKQSTEKGDPHRSYLKNPEDISKYEESATKMAQVFIDLVVEKRKNVAKSALKGAYYPADEAKALGLIDGIGSMEYVEQRMQKQLEFYKKTG